MGMWVWPHWDHRRGSGSLLPSQLVSLIGQQPQRSSLDSPGLAVCIQHKHAAARGVPAASSAFPAHGSHGKRAPAAVPGSGNRRHRGKRNPNPGSGRCRISCTEQGSGCSSRHGRAAGTGVGTVLEGAGASSPSLGRARLSVDPVGSCSTTRALVRGIGSAGGEGGQCHVLLWGAKRGGNPPESGNLEQSAVSAWLSAAVHSPAPGIAPNATRTRSPVTPQT